MSHHGCPERLSNRAKGFSEDSTNQTMEVLVETLTGTAFEMTVSPSDTVLAIKSKICRVEGIPVSQQHLLHNLQELEDSQSLSSAGVKGGSRLRLVLGLRGGPVGTRQLPTPYRSRDEECASCLSCRVALVVLRDGRRVRVIGVAPQQQHSASSPQVWSEPEPSTSAADEDANAVTAHKMAALRRRLQGLSLSTRTDHGAADIQKTRSEETLSVPYPHCSDERDDAINDYTYFGCSFADRYTLLPPLSNRAESAQSISPSDLQLCELAEFGSLSTQEEDALLEECLDGLDHTRDGYAGVGAGCGWHSAWSVGAGPPPPAPPLLYSCSTPTLDTHTTNRILPSLSRHRNRDHLHWSDEGLHRDNVQFDEQEHQILELSPEDLDVDSDERLFRVEAVTLPPVNQGVSNSDQVDCKPKESDKKTEKKTRLRCAWCRCRVTIATVHWCRCGRQYCAPHRYKEVHGCSYDYKAGGDTVAIVRDTRLPRI